MSAPEITTTPYSAADILTYLQNSGTINIDDVAADMEKERKDKILKQHPYPITKGRDGRYRTYVKSEGEKRRQIAKSSYEKVVDALLDFYEGKSEVVVEDKSTLATLYPQWLEYKRLHGASSTYLKRIDSDWHNYYAGTDIIRIPLANLKKLMLDVWAHELIERVGHVKKQYYNISMIMRQMLDYAVDAELIQTNPLQKVKIEARQVFLPVKKKASETQVFTTEEVEALYHAAREDFDSEHNTVHKLAPLAVMFQFQTGVRIGELCALRYEDIEDSEIFVNRMYRFVTKEVVEYTKAHNAGRYVALTAEAKSLIETAKRYQQEHSMCDSGYIFSVNEEPLSYYAIRKLYERYCKEIGTVKKSSHKSRKTYISALIDGGVNINAIRELVGHADERTTYNSYCYDRKTKSERVTMIENALSGKV